MIEGEQDAKDWLRELPTYDDLVLSRLVAFSKLLADENQSQNLVSASSLKHVWQRHIVDSAQLLRFVPREAKDWLDLGTGAGFPGLVVAMVDDERQVTLVESRSKRSDWLKRIRDTLKLANVVVIAGYVEALVDRKFQAISARAFAPLERLIDQAARFSTSETMWVLPKGLSAEQELAKLDCWHHTFHVERSLTDPAAGIIVGRLLGKT